MAFANSAGQTSPSVSTETAPNITNSHGNPGMVAHTLRGAGADASEDGTGRGVPLVLAHGQANAEVCEGYCPTLNCNHEQPILAAGFDRAQISNPDNRSRVDPALAQPTLSGSGEACVPADLIVRRLTPRECERLQGFPDDYTLVPFGPRGRLAKDSPRYTALGNSMAVNVMSWIGRRIQWAEARAQMREAVRA